MKKTLCMTIALIGSLQAAEPQSYWSRFASWWNSTTPSQYIPSAATCKAFVKENPVPTAIGALAVGGYFWYRWYNQQEKQILRAVISSNVPETERLLNQLVADVNAATGTPDFAKKQVAALNIFRDILTQMEKQVYEWPEMIGLDVVRFRVPLMNETELLTTIYVIAAPYKVAWTLAELEPVYTKLFEHSVKADADFKNSIQEAQTYGKTLDEIRDIVFASIKEATKKDNAIIREQNTNEIVIRSIISRKYSDAQQAAKSIVNLETKLATLQMIRAARVADLGRANLAIDIDIDLVKQEIQAQQ